MMLATGIELPQTANVMPHLTASAFWLAGRLWDASRNALAMELRDFGR
jgi:hypothetical protein